MLICIGGVCVPYTAVIPICILALKWFAAKLAQWGLLPKKLQELMHLPQATKEGENNTQEKSSIGLKNSGPSIVKTLESEEDFHKLVNGKNKVVCKFTATW